MKGVVAQPMPKAWYNEKAAADSSNPIDEAICASKKPYFMIYRYPEQRARYLAFHEAANAQSLLMFGVPFNQLDSIEQTESVQNFRMWYDRLCPVQRSNGVINRICAMCEAYFASAAPRTHSEHKFDPSILKSGVAYSVYTKNKVYALYQDYMWRLRQANASHMPEDELIDYRRVLGEEFKAACAEACPAEDELCEIVLDICYGRENSKQFAWDMCGEAIVNNLLLKNGSIHFPCAAKNGSVVYGGRRYKLQTLEVGNNEGYCAE